MQLGLEVGGVDDLDLEEDQRRPLGNVIVAPDLGGLVAVVVCTLPVRFVRDQIQAGDHTITAAHPPPPDRHDVLALIHADRGAHSREPSQGLIATTGTSI